MNQPVFVSYIRAAARCGIRVVLTLLLPPMLGMASAAHAQTRSDLLIVLDTDGIGYTAQQTLFSLDELILIRLPAGRQTLDTTFAGANSLLHQRAHEDNPDKLTLTSGSVFTRFRHRFNEPAQSQASKEDPDTTPLRAATLDQFDISMISTSSLDYSVSWLLPPNLELVNLRPSESDLPGAWQQDGPLLTFRHGSGIPEQSLRIEYRVHSLSGNRADACLSSIGPSEWCSPDVDNDRVPDYRDLCLNPESDAESVPTTGNILSDTVTSDALTDATAITARTDSLGCDDDARIVLSDVQFDSGQTYLGAKARLQLDKTAVALLRLPDKLYRIAAYTDNAGYFDNNQVLSKNRADAIRHYLMLRGVSPNQLQARGYGEANPAHDNTTAAGRRANRRVELQILNQ